MGTVVAIRMPNVGADGNLIDLDALREADERNEEV